MASWVNRKRGDGGTSVQIRWREDGQVQSETFTNLRLAGEFKAAVEAGGNVWSRSLVVQRGSRNVSHAKEGPSNQSPAQSAETTTQRPKTALPREPQQCDECGDPTTFWQPVTVNGEPLRLPVPVMAEAIVRICDAHLYANLLGRGAAEINAALDLVTLLLGSRPASVAAAG
jgi:hypothetical protein